MKKNLTPLVAALFFASSIMAQTSRTVIVEHFTNTLCSICASKNPTFYSTMTGYPDVLYISYHPSAPYVNCKFSKENRPENDARTNYYGVYGSTPRVVIEGVVIPGKTPAISTTDIDTMLHKFSPLALSIKMTRVDADSVDVNITALTTAAHSYSALYMYAAVTEDTILYTGGNGEAIHYGVFHKQLFADNGLRFNPAQAVGDSVRVHSGFRISAVDSIWNPDRINVIGMVQDSTTRYIVQAAKQTKIDTAVTIPTGIDEASSNEVTLIYPNPASGEIIFTDAAAKYIAVYTVSGQLIKEENNIQKSVSVSDLPVGLYFLHIKKGNDMKQIRILSVIH